MTIALALEQLLNGLQLGVMLFLMAAGLTLIFGVMRIINLAHGSLYMVGAFACAAVAAVFTILVCLFYALLSRSHFGEEKNGDRHRTMHITVPESLEYAGAFDDIFDTYTESRRLVHVKTTSLGSLNRLTYDITLRRAGEEKAFIDALRCRNGNLEISLMQHAAEGCEL